MAGKKVDQGALQQAWRHSHEEDTAAGELADDVPEAEKVTRWEQVMATQARVAAAHGAAAVGRVVEVLVEESEGGRLLGRTSQQAPEIDGQVRLEGDAEPGTLVAARVVGADTYDLDAKILAAPVDSLSSSP